MSWPLLSYGLVNSVFFGTYSKTLRYLNGDVEMGTKPKFLEIWIAGCVGGVAQLSVAVPVEVIKVVLQAQIPHNTNISTGNFHVYPLYLHNTAPFLNIS